ncbi:MAG: glucose-6-phosphate isomerase [Nanohaloarchaea archaeon]|nr:glucose-6-phosphate isomerase [Candidatus Nanohaloarchaea archaeon]
MKMFIEKITGMNLHYDNATKDLILDEKPIKKSIRILKDMKDVIFNKEWLNQINPERKMYYMFRDISKEEDRTTTEENNLRYDITVIPPDLMGEEFVKTQGHTHPSVQGTKTTYAEMYQVLNGHALFLIETKDGKDTKTSYIYGKDGDIIIVPPNHSHVTINPTDEILIIANWVERNFKSDYRPILKNHGLSYYLIKKDDKRVFIKNPHAKGNSELTEMKPINPEVLGLEKDEPIYRLIKTPEKLEFLTRPQDYEILFKKITSEE